jgi:hypothetical protein
MERALFIAGIALIAFLYGAFTVQYQVFPYSLLKEAKLGLAAWAAVDRNNSRFPKAFERFEKDAPPVPQARQLDAGSGSEQILPGSPNGTAPCCTHGKSTWMSCGAGFPASRAM